MMEGADTYCYEDLRISSVNDAGLVFKPNRAVVWLFGDSLVLEYIQLTSRATSWKMVAKANAAFHRPGQNFARIKRG